MFEILVWIFYCYCIYNIINLLCAVWGLLKFI